MASPATTGTGRIVDTDGEPLSSLMVLCCSHSLCYTGETNENGAYEITGIDPEDSYKMQVADPMQVYNNAYYYQAIIAGETSVLDVDVVLTRRQTMPRDWSSATGGEVTLAGGELTLNAAPGSVEYPIGEPESVMADRISGSTLPPYKSRPWTVNGDALIVYTFNPMPIVSAEPVAVQITVDGLGASGAQWQIYSLNPDTANVDNVGLATVNEAGMLVSNEDATLTNLLTLILVPTAP
jgi:hypothetical protein